MLQFVFPFVNLGSQKRPVTPDSEGVSWAVPFRGDAVGPTLILAGNRTALSATKSLQLRE